MIRRVITTIKRQFFDCWWVYLFALLCFICYEQGGKARNVQFQILSQQLKLLQQDKVAALARQEELTSKLASQSDDEWIELLLIKELGVVPEGQQKVYFLQ